MRLLRGFLCAAIVICGICLFPTTSLGDIALDGVLGGHTYANSQAVSWYNGHQTSNSVYGDFINQLGTATIRFEVSTLEGDISGTQYFFVYVEAPLAVKTMIWDNNPLGGWKKPLDNTDPNAGLTESDVASYRIHHETHHAPGNMKLDYNGATGSEKLILVDNVGADVFEAELDGSTDTSYGLVAVKNSLDYLLDNSISTLTQSLARNTAMSFEFQFDLDAVENQAFLDLFSNGLQFHLSPERGLAQVPEPNALGMMLVGMITFTSRRVRKRL